MRRILIVLLLSGCAATPTTQQVNLPVTQPCLGAPPLAPTWHYGIDAAANEGDLARQVLADLIAAKQYIRELLVQQSRCE